MAKTLMCVNCGFIGTPKKKAKGYFSVEVILWLCFLVPGLIYSFWRLASKRPVCPRCGADGMIPADSPAATMLKKQFGMLD